MKNFIENTTFNKKYAFWFEIVFGILCGALNRGTAFIDHTSIPLYLDTIFTVTASFFGMISGTLSVISFHIFSVLFCGSELQVATFLFSICSFSIVFIVRLSLSRMKKITLLEILFLILLITSVVAVEGGIIYTFIFEKFNYQESQQVKYLTYALLRQNISVIVSSIFVRVPINLIDKSISVLVGFFTAIFVDRIYTKFDKSSQNKKIKLNNFFKNFF